MKSSQKTRQSLCALALLLALSHPGSAQTFNWAASGLDGAGTQTCLAIQPGGTQVILSASDVSGIQRSTDEGLTWQGANVGTPSGGPGNAAVVAWTNSTSNANTAYAGDTDGFLSSSDAGATWSLLSTTPTFLGNGTSIRWPRSTGNLIACDQASSFPGYLYCGSVNPSTGSGGAVMRSTDGGSTWTTIFTTTDYIRGIALDPSKTSNLFVATFGNGVYHTTAARTVGTGGWTQLSGGPNQPEELLVLTDDTLYAAGGDTSAGGGVWKSASPYTSWTKLSGLLTASGTTYLAIAGYGTGASAVIYAGASSAAQDGSSYASIQKSTNGGTSWSDVTSAANGNVVNAIGGAGGPVWWMGLAGGGYMLGTETGDLDNIQIDPSNSNNVFTGGRGGIWGTTNGTASASALRWYPMVAGLSVSGCYGAAGDPNNPGRVYIGNEDWVFFYSADSGVTFRRNAPSNEGDICRSIAVDPSNSEVYAGTITLSSEGGSVFSNTNPTTGTAWTDTLLDNADGNLNVRGVYARHNSSNQLVLLACVETSGIWQKIGSGAWTFITSSIQSTDFVQFAGNANSNDVYAYDRAHGLWRSTNSGASWTNIWSTTTSSTYSGYVVEDPTDGNSGRLYVSVDSGVFRLDGAASGTPTQTNLSDPGTNPGPIALDSNGRLYCANTVSSTQNGTMYLWTSPSSSATSTLISNATTYAGQSEWPTQVVVDSQGTVYISEKDEGCMVGTPLDLFSDNFTAGAGNWTADTGTWAIVDKSGTDYYEESNTSGGIAHVNVSGSSSWQNYSVSATITPLAFTSGSVGISLYFSDSNDRYIAQITPTGACSIKLDDAGTQTTLASGTTSTASTYPVKFSVNNSTKTLTMFVNGTQVAQYVDGSALTFTAGTVALNTYTSTADFSNVVVTQP